MRAVFLDRDGVITENNQSMVDGPFYVTSISHLIYRPGALDAIAILCKQGYQCFLVTSQRWVGLNFIQAAPVMAKIHTRFLNDVMDEGGFIIDSRYIFNQVDNKAKHIEQLVEVYNIDAKQSYVIGDANNDIMAGKECGIQTVFIQNDYGVTQNPGADFECSCLDAAVEWILEGGVGCNI